MLYIIRIHNGAIGESYSIDRFYSMSRVDMTEKKSISRDRLLDLLKSHPKHTAKTMASCLGLSVQAIQKQIAILKAEKRLQRIGPDNGGCWKVLNQSLDIN